MDVRVLDLVNKLQHELPEVRDRSVSSLHSKVVVSGLVAASSFPADDFAVALLGFLQARPVSSSVTKALRLVLELAQNHPSGAVALCHRGGVRILETMDTPGPSIGSPSDPRALADLLRSKHPDALPCPPSATPLTEDASAQLQHEEGIYSGAGLSSSSALASPSPSIGMAQPQSSHLSSATSSPPPAAVPAPRGAHPSRTNEIWSPLISPRATPSMPMPSMSSAVASGASALTSTPHPPVPTSEHSSSTLSANPSPPTTAYEATSESWAAAATTNPWAACAYHDGWRPSGLPIDGADMRRVVEVEAGLAQGRDARARAAAAGSLAALCRDMPIDALLTRPPALHALVAAFAGPLCELASSSNSSSGKSSPISAGQKAATSPPPRVFGHLLEALLDALEECVAALKRTQQNHFNASLIGGAAAAAATQAAHAALHSEADEGSGRMGDNSSGGEMHQAALWSPVRMRCPSPRTPHQADLDFTFAARAAAAAAAANAAQGSNNEKGDTAAHCHSDDVESPSSATPLSLGGAALLLLRVALDLVATASGASGAHRPTGHQGLAAKGFSVIAQLLPLLAEPILQPNQGDHASGAMEQYRRAVVVARTQAALQAWVQTMEATGMLHTCMSSSGDDGDQGECENAKGRHASLLLGALAQDYDSTSGGAGGCGVAPLLLALPELLAGPHAPIALECLRCSGLAGHSGGEEDAGNKNNDSWAFVAVPPLVAEILEALACSAVLALCRPRVHALAGTAFAAVCPEASTHLQEASARAHVTAPLAHQLILRGSGTDNTIDDDVDRRPEDCANDLAGPAAAQVASPSEASAWLERALAQVSQVASDLTGVLNQKDARALADLVVLLWALSASEPLALALMQPAIDLPHALTHVASAWSFHRAAAESVLLGLLAEPCYTAPTLNALAGLLGNPTTSSISGPLATAARTLGLHKLGLVLQPKCSDEQVDEHGGSASPAEAACEALMTSDIGRTLLLRCASFVDLTNRSCHKAAAAAAVVCALAKAAGTSATDLSSAPNAPALHLCLRSGLLNNLDAAADNTNSAVNAADTLVISVFNGSTTGNSSAAWRDLFHKDASVRRSALPHLLAGSEATTVDPWASSTSLPTKQGDDVIAALRSYASNDNSLNNSSNDKGSSSGPAGSVLGKLQRAGDHVTSHNSSSRPAFGAGDSAALAGLIADRGLSPQTRAAAANQLAAVLGASLLKPTQLGTDMSESTPLSAPGAAVAVVRASLLECVNGLQGGANKEGTLELAPDWEGPRAALDLLLVLLWAQPCEVRPALLQPFSSDEGFTTNIVNNSNSRSPLATSVLPWLRAAGSPQPALRAAAATAALIAWRCCFDPLDFAVNPTGKFTNENRGCAVYPPALLATFPSPPLGPLAKLAKLASNTSSGANHTCTSTQLLPGLLEARTSSSVEARAGATSDRARPLRPAAAAYLASTLFSMLYPTNLFVKALASVEEEAANRVDESAEGWAKVRAERVRSDAAVFAWMSPREAAHALRVAMASAQSHAALSACLDTAAAWVAADELSDGSSSSSKCGSGVGSHGNEESITFVQAFAQSSSTATHAAPSYEVSVPPEWHKALAPLLAQPPAAPRDRQVLLAAIPLLRALAQRGLGPSGRRKLAVCACSALIPLLSQDAERRSGNKSETNSNTTGSNGNRTPSSALGVGRRSPIDLSATATAALPTQPRPWEPLPPWSPVRSINNTSFTSSSRSCTPGMESPSGGGARSGNSAATAPSPSARGPSRTVAVLQVQVLGLLSDLVEADESFALGAPSHMDSDECDVHTTTASPSVSSGSGGVCSVLSGCAPLFSALANLLLRRTPSSYLAPSVQGHDAACVPSVALQLLGTFARSATRLASYSSTAPHSSSTRASSSSAIGIGGGGANVWVRALPDLLRGSLSLAGVPRLPDTFAHKQLARPALASARALAHLDTQLHAQQQQGQTNQMQQSVALKSPALMSLGPKLVLGWCRRLSVDREASVRAAAFGLLGHTWALPHWWSHGQGTSLRAGVRGDGERRSEREARGDEEESQSGSEGSPGGWNRQDAIRACVRAVCDPSEAPVVRAEAANALAAAIASTSSCLSSESPEAREASWSALESSRSGDSLDPSSESGARFEATSDHRGHNAVANEDNLSLARGLSACVNAIAASPYDGSALSPCFTASAAQLLAAAASAHANFALGGVVTSGASPTVAALCLFEETASSAGDTEAPRDEFARHFGGACLAVAAWADASHLAALNAHAASNAQAGSCLESTTKGLPWPGAEPMPCRTAVGVAMRALRNVLAAARSVDGVLRDGSYSSNNEALRSALLRSSYLLATLLRALTAADDNDGMITDAAHAGCAASTSRRRTRTAVMALHANATRWTEAAELLSDLLVEDRNAAALLGGSCHTSATPPALALALAHAIDRNTHLHSDLDNDGDDDHDDFGTGSNLMSGSAPGCGHLFGSLSEQVRFSALRLAVALLQAPGWGSSAAAHSKAAPQLWRALVRARLSLATTTTSTIRPSAGAGALVAAAAAAEASLHVHAALAALAAQAPEVLVGAEGMESLAMAVASEVSLLASTATAALSSGDSTSRLSGVSATTTAAVTGVPVMVALQARLGLLRCLSSQDLSAACAGDLGRLLDRAWPALAALGNHPSTAHVHRGVNTSTTVEPPMASAAAAASSTEPSCLSVPCLALLADALGALAHASPQHAAMLCSPPPRPDGHAATTSSSAGSVVSSSSFSSSMASGRGPGAQGIVAKRLLVAALAGSGASGGASSYGGLPPAAVVAATRTLVPFMACAEGRALLLQHSGVAQFVSVLNSALAAPRRRRQAAGERAVAVLRLLATATLHEDLQRALLQVPEFADFLNGATELFESFDKEHSGRHLPSAGSAAAVQPTVRHAAAATPPAFNAASVRGVGWRDPLAAAGVRELCALLVRNLARHRTSHKGRLVASSAVFKFLLRSLCPRDTGADSSEDGVPLRVAAACSAALWSLLHHSARAAPALRQLQADVPVAAALQCAQHMLSRQSTIAAPSVQRTAHHLAMVQLLLARADAEA